jgi:hypothetical protein
MWPLGHEGAVDLGPCWWEGSAKPVLRSWFSVFRVKVCRGGAQVVMVAPRAIRSPGLQPHLGSNIERLVGVVWSSRISSGCGDLRIVKELHRQFFLLLRLRDGSGLLEPFGDFLYVTNNVRTTQGGAATAAPHRHSLEVKDEGLSKDLIVIFVFLGCFVLFVISINARFLFAQRSLHGSILIFLHVHIWIWLRLCWTPATLKQAILAIVVSQIIDKAKTWSIASANLCRFLSQNSRLS